MPPFLDRRLDLQLELEHRRPRVDRELARLQQRARHTNAPQLTLPGRLLRGQLHVEPCLFRNKVLGQRLGVVLQFAAPREEPHLLTGSQHQPLVDRRLELPHGRVLEQVGKGQRGAEVPAVHAVHRTSHVQRARRLVEIGVDGLSQVHAP